MLTVIISYKCRLKTGPHHGNGPDTLEYHGVSLDMERTNGTFPEGSGGMNLNTIINIVIFKTSPCFYMSISLFKDFIISIIIESIDLILEYHINSVSTLYIGGSTLECQPMIG